MRDDERQLLIFTAAHGRIPPPHRPQLGREKRTLYILDKWERKGWWESGVSSISGWITAEGRSAAEEAQ